jgi:dTDP-4-amino-4,6-dideoxygalactose transaminase
MICPAKNRDFTPTSVQWCPEKEKCPQYPVRQTKFFYLYIFRQTIRMQIPFNKPFFSGREQQYMREAVERGHISGNGYFTKRCHAFFSKRFGFLQCLLTTSCTDALEMAALLINLQPGDEVIMPSYTFVSTANAFVLRGARIVFADSLPGHPNMDPEGLKKLVTPRTKAIVVVHYAGVACDMDPIMELAQRHQLWVIEDAAQAIDSYYKGRPLGSIGHLAAFSFHETKNIISGEGGMLVVNEPAFEKRAEILWEKGTNRAAFFRGETDKYSWVDLGSSFLPSDLIAAFLLAQLEQIEMIQQRRLEIWYRYRVGLKPLEEKKRVQLPAIPPYATNNAHLFYIMLPDAETRQHLIHHLRQQGIMAVFHYLSLHRSAFYQMKHDGRQLPHCDRFSEGLLRLPLFFELTNDEVDYIIREIRNALD